MLLPTPPPLLTEDKQDKKIAADKFIDTQMYFHRPNDDALTRKDLDRCLTYLKQKRGRTFFSKNKKRN